ncbi:MAG: hypothetical protein ACQEXN_15070 [Actinomycetota bacterium]
MKYRVALAGLFVLATLMAGCGDSPGSSSTSNTVTGPNGEILLVNPNSRTENFTMEAGFVGTLLLTEDKCITGRTDYGLDLGLIFPAGTRFGDGEPLTVEVEGQTFEVGSTVSLGGGVLSLEDSKKLIGDLQEGCLKDEMFYVQTVS